MNREFGFLDSIDSLSEEQIIAYLFSSNLPYGVKQVICDEVNKFEISNDKLKRIKSLFIKNGIFDEKLLFKDYCPIEIKKIILDEIYNGEFFSVILDDSTSNQRKKLIIDLRLTVSDAISLLKRDLSLELRNYIISSRFTDNASIISILKDDDVSDELKEKIVIRNINIDNIFNIIKETPFSVTSFILRYKRRDIDDYFNSLNADNILDVIINAGVKKNFFEDLLKNK